MAISLVVIRLADSFEQSNNTVNNGDIVAGDKYNLVIKREIPKAIAGIRDDIGLKINCDGDNTTLLKKLTDGKLNPHAKRHAIMAKIDTINILIKICKKQSGRKVASDIYANLVAIVNKHIICMEEDDLLKFKINDLYEDFALLVSKYQHLELVDEAFMEGLLYIATSNCAIRWKVEDIA